MNVLINFFFVCILCFFFSFEGNCQGVNKIERKIERKVQQRWDRKVDKTIDQGLDKIEGSIDKKTSPPPSQNKGRQSENANSPTIQNGESKTINSNFDFIPGDEVLFYDDFEHDLAGDFPQKWNTNNSGEIVNIKGLQGKWLKIPDNTISFPELPGVLPDNFTVEFDLYYSGSGTRPPVTFGFSKVKNPAKQTLQNNSIFYFIIPPSIKDNIGYSFSLYSGKEITQTWPANKNAGKIIHFNIAVNKQRIRLYADGSKIFDVPKALDDSQIRNNFHFRAAPLLPKPNEAFYVSNIRIASSGADFRSQINGSGNYVTSGIQFATGSAKINPNSHYLLNEIGKVLKEQQGLRVKIVGHTDNVGSSESNLQLSLKRAEGVKQYLIRNFAIEDSRLLTEGKGDAQPLSNQNDAEGRAKNRRVAFTLLK